MPKKSKIDKIIIVLCILVIAISAYGIGNKIIEAILICLFSICLVGYAFIFLKNRNFYRNNNTVINNKINDGSITELLLLNEEGKIIATWDMFEKVSLVIGKDIKENHVDVNLNQSPYAAMVDIEHAVLNYAANNWYIEDLGSKNGLVLQKAMDNRKYRLSADQPCKLDPGDIIIIGLIQLRVR